MALPLLPILLLGGAGVALVMMSQKKTASADAAPVVTKTAASAKKPDPVQCQGYSAALYQAHCAWLATAGQAPAVRTAAAAKYTALAKAWPSSCGSLPDTRGYNCTAAAVPRGGYTYRQDTSASQTAGAASAAAYKAQGGYTYAQDTGGEAAATAAQFKAEQAAVAAAPWGPTNPPAQTMTPEQANAIDAWLREHSGTGQFGVPASTPAVAPAFNDYSQGNANLFPGGASASGSFKVGF